MTRLRKEFHAFCEECMQDMTHVSKDGTLLFCTSCWVPVPIPSDCRYFNHNLAIARDK